MAPTASASESPAGGQSYGTPNYRGYVLLSLTLVYTLNFIDRNLLGVLAPPIVAEFGLTDTEYGFLNGPPFALFYALMGIPIAMAAIARISALPLQLASVRMARIEPAAGKANGQEPRLPITIGHGPYAYRLCADKPACSQHHYSMARHR